jgi:hypothetical protein
MLINEYRPKKYRYTNKSDLGYYLAGLIDGDGHFDTQGKIVICFNEKDKALAYQIKSCIGYGIVRKVNGKKAYTFSIQNKAGIIKVANLIQNKLCHCNRIFQYNKYLQARYPNDISLTKKFRINFESSWLAGFADSDGSFRIYPVVRERSDRNNKIYQEARLLFRVDQKKRYLLDEIKNYFGGSISFRKSQNTFYYDSVSHTNIRKYLHYFDNFPLQSTKYLHYFYVRKCFLIVQKKMHLIDYGWNKILTYKKQLDNLRKN